MTAWVSRCPIRHPRLRERCGFGLFSIRERLRPYGGVLEVQSEPGAGTHVILTVPLADRCRHGDLP